MKRFTFAAVVVLLVVFPWRQATTAQQIVYTVESLATSASIGNLVPAETGINASGEVVGTVTDSLGRTRAVRFTFTGGIGIGWEYVPGLTWGSTASGINASGDIVGSQMVGGFSHAYRYNAHTGNVDDILPLTNGSTSLGLAINDNGDVVGQSDAGNGAARGFLARPGLPAVVLPTLGGTSDMACGVNNSDQVALNSTDPVTGFPHAARVEADGVTIMDAGTVDGTPGFSTACAIDDPGHIGGFSSALNFLAFHAYRWNPGNPVAVDATLPSSFGNVESIANGMSAGWYMSTLTGTNFAMLHTDANGAVDLNTQIPANSGWVLTQIKGINASGQMVGDGLLNGALGVFRLTPPNPKDTTPPVISSVTPSPSTISVVNGQMTPVTVAVSATDDDGKMPTCQISSITGAGATDFSFNGLNAAVLAIGGRTYVLNVTCSDAAGNTSSKSANVVVLTDTTPPVISNITANPNNIWPPAQQMVPVVITVTATDDSGVVSCGLLSISGPGTPGVDYRVTGQFSGVVKAFAGRTYVFNAQCVDFSGNVTPASVNVVVPPDTIPPAISLVSASPSVIWPPDNKMVAVNVTVAASDIADPAPVCALTSISSYNPYDSAITGQLAASVRAKNGEVYTLTVTCTDFYGNASSASTTVAVTQVNGAVAGTVATAKRSGR
jgi:hypothetical protein